MAVEMKKEDQDALAAAGAAWNNATTQAEKYAAHAQAEAIRAKYEYSGGADGSQHIPITTTTSKNTSGNSQYTAVGNGSDYYAGQKMVTVSDAADTAKLYGNAKAGQDTLEIIVAGNDEQFTVTALFDNLGKGASGAAVQNMNIMLGFDADTGLTV